MPRWAIYHRQTKKIKASKQELHSQLKTGVSSRMNLAERLCLFSEVTARLGLSTSLRTRLKTSQPVRRFATRLSARSVLCN